MTREELNQDVDNHIINQPQQNTFTKVRAILKRILDYIDFKITNIQLMPGPQGVQGVPGPVGPAGLEWRGAWNANTSYNEDDAVGFGGASYFCIAPVTGTGNSNPTIDTAKWALLAAQGAPGQDATLTPKTSGVVGAGTDPYSVLTFDINTVYENNATYRLPKWGPEKIGHELIVKNTASSVSIKNFDETPKITAGQVNGFSSVLSMRADECYKFIYLGNDYWLPSYINIKRLKVNNVDMNYINILYLAVNTSDTSEISLSHLNMFYSDNSVYPVGFRLLCPSIASGPLVYTKLSNTQWAKQPMTLVT